MDLFDYMREQNKEKESPLASRMRPSTLDEVVGQKHITGRSGRTSFSLLFFTDLREPERQRWPK